MLPDLTDERASRGSRPSVSAPLRPPMAVEAREQERQQQQGEEEEQRASAPVAPARTRCGGPGAWAADCRIGPRGGKGRQQRARVLFETVAEEVLCMKIVWL